MRLRRLLLPLLCLLALPACERVHTTGNGAVGIDRAQMMFSLLPEAEVEQMAAQSYRAELRQAADSGRLNRDPQLTQRIRHIVQRLIPHVSAFRTDALQWQWEVNVADSPQVNAYCAPGGKIMVLSGIVQQLKLSDDEIAAVLGHEIAHALREHGRERLSEAWAKQLLAQGISLVTDGKYDRQLQLALDVSQVAISLPNSREHEQEADAIGLELAARAGYDPQAAVRLWQKMRRFDSGQPPQFLSTHPSHESRIQELQALLSRVQPLYDAADKG